MTVKELIEKLQQMDPNMEVRIGVTDPTDFDYQVDVEDVRVEVTNWENEMDDVELNDDGDVISGKKVILIDGGIV